MNFLNVIWSWEILLLVTCAVTCLLIQALKAYRVCYFNPGTLFNGVEINPAGLNN